MTALGALGDTSGAYAINDSGAVVGFSNLPNDNTWHGCMWSDGNINDLGTLGGDTIAYGINSAGEVVGTSSIYSDFYEPHAFLWKDSLMVVSMI